MLASPHVSLGHWLRADALASDLQLGRSKIAKEMVAAQAGAHIILDDHSPHRLLLPSAAMVRIMNLIIYFFAGIKTTINPRLET